MTHQSLDDQVLDLMTEIVRSYMPNEVSVFELKRKQGRLRVASLSSSNDADRARDLTSDFGPSEKIALECVPLVLGSFKAAFELLRTLREGKKTSQATKIDEVQKKWHEDLVKAGLSSKRASQITSKFADDLVRILR
jgi:hypothetical protein